MNAHRRYLLLYGLRWLPTGLMIPVSVLLALHRGLSLAEFGSVAALQGIAVMVLELPTGGLTDALGRRPVLLLAGEVGVAASGVLLVARSVPLYALYFVGMGIFRALDSGPLEAWYVDHALAADPSADIESGLSHGAVVLGVAVGGGALLSGGLVAAGPIGPLPALAVPVAAAFVLQLVSVAAVAGLMTDERPGRGAAALIASVRGVPAAVGGAVQPGVAELDGRTAGVRARRRGADRRRHPRRRPGGDARGRLRTGRSRTALPGEIRCPIHGGVS